MQLVSEASSPWLPLHELVRTVLSEMTKERKSLKTNPDQHSIEPALPAGK